MKTRGRDEHNEMLQKTREKERSKKKTLGKTKKVRCYLIDEKVVKEVEIEEIYPG